MRRVRGEPQPITTRAELVRSSARLASERRYAEHLDRVAAESAITLRNERYTLPERLDRVLDRRGIEARVWSVERRRVDLCEACVYIGEDTEHFGGATGRIEKSITKFGGRNPTVELGEPSRNRDGGRESSRSSSPDRWHDQR